MHVHVYTPYALIFHSDPEGCHYTQAIAMGVVRVAVLDCELEQAETKRQQMR
jgi:hypothetical protein